MSKLSDYAVRVMTHMVKAGEDQAYSARNLAERSHLPLPTVVKLLKLLERARLLCSERGALGGYRLAKPALDISVVDIMTAVEGPVGLTQCTITQHIPCERRNGCPTHGHWSVITQVMNQLLENLSLADMAQPLSRHGLQQLLAERTAEQARA